MTMENQDRKPDRPSQPGEPTTPPSDEPEKTGLFPHAKPTPPNEGTSGGVSLFRHFEFRSSGFSVEKEARDGLATWRRSLGGSMPWEREEKAHAGHWTGLD